MWASSARYQCSGDSKLRSLDWIESHRPLSANCENWDCGNAAAAGGWLAAGGEQGKIGINWISNEIDTSSNICAENSSNTCSLYKSSFNLKGHIGGVSIIRWRPQGDKLATYDTWGNFKIWKIRSSVLAVDHEVTTTIAIKDIQWSYCGNYIAICGENGQLQLCSSLTALNLFSVQVLTSSSFNSYAQFSTLSWNKTSTRIAVGTAKGEIMDVDPSQNGHAIGTIVVRKDVPIIYTKYFGTVHEQEVQTPHGAQRVSTQSLSLYLANGEVVIFDNVSSTQCMCVYTGLVNGQAKWNSFDTLLAVVGYNRTGSINGRFLNGNGSILLTIDKLIAMEPGNDIQLQSICWALGDETLFIANDKDLYSIDIHCTIPSLVQLCREYIVANITGNKQDSLNQLPLPSREINALSITSPSLLLPVIDLTDHSLLFTPLAFNTRLHCIMIPVDTSNGDYPVNTYIMKYEHFGSYVPVLKAKKRTGRFFNVGFTIQQEIPSPGIRNDNYLARVTSRNSLSSLLNSHTETENDSSPVIAEIDGNTLTKYYKFTANSTTLATLSITSHYMRCMPRDLTITIFDDNNKKEVLNSKKPQWNSMFGIFELDFGGRINRDSAKNFQIEHENKVVFQFGKSVFGHYCVDFQHPFSPIVAFSVALASVV